MTVVAEPAGGPGTNGHGPPAAPDAPGGGDPVHATPQPLPPDAGGWVRRMSPFLLAHKRKVILAVGAAIAGQGVSALVPVVQRAIIDDGIVHRNRAVWPFLLLLLLAAAFSFGASYVRRWQGGRVSLDTQFDLRNAIYERLQRLDFAGHDRLQTGQLVSRASTDLGLIQALLAFLPLMLGNVIMLAVSLVVMVVISPPLTLVMLVAVPAMVAVSFRLRATVFPATWDAQQRAAEVAGVVDEAVAGVRVVKGFGQEDREIRHLAARAGELYAARSRLIRLQARFGPALQAIPALAQVAVLGFGGWLALEGRLSLGDFLVFSSYLVQLVGPVRMLAMVFAVTQQARAGAERLLDVLDANPLVVERPGASDLTEATGRLHFDGVRFGYTKTEPVLDDFDLTVEAGEVVALVGASGSGKSTVTALLPRFYDVSAGRITIDGTDVREVTLHSLRQQVGVVFEEAFLFSDTVWRNIAYGQPDATDAQVRAAAAAAGADRFIDALPDGYDTTVGERGLTLSGGQRQRIALARAILTNPRILVLDDATSAVDATTEEAIHDTLRALMKDRTTILIAHRRSTLRLASRIVVMEGGRAVEAGTHEQLVATSERYRLLLAGPGEDAEGVFVSNAEGVFVSKAEGVLVPAAEGADVSGSLERAAVIDTPAATGVTASAWPALDGADADGPRAAVAAAPRVGGPGGGGGPGGNMGMALTATPELLERLAKLPPADDDPHVELADAVKPGNDADGFRVLRFIRPWRRWLGLGLALVIVDAGLTLLGPLMVRRGIDLGVVGGDRDALHLSVAVFAAAVLADWVVTWAYTRLTGRTAERMLYALRLKIFAHLQRLSLDYYDRELDGRIMTRMTTDVEALSQLIQTGLIQAIVGAVTCVGVFGFLVVLSPPLALAAASVLPPLIIATVWYRRRSSVSYRKARDSIADVNANLQESLSGVRVSQAYGREDRNIRAFRAVNKRYLSDRLGAQKLIAVYFNLVLFLADAGAAVVLGAGAYLVDRDVVTAGVVIAFVLYLNQFFSPIQQLSQVLDTWQQATASTDKIEELLSLPSGTPAAAVPVVPATVTGEIRLEGVHFRYPNTAGDEALAGIDLHVRPGRTLALVGETGAGKSTIVKLMARYYDPVAGRVLIDGVDLRALDLGTYRRRLGVVPQEAFLFTGTVRANIAYGRPDASDAEIEAAARAVGAHDFVAGLPQGYLTPVSERGRSLSAGQRQLMALARAQLVDPAILLLDEATSQLDLASEAKVQRAMSTVAAGRTTVLVAHRLPTARHADEIAVIAGGRIAERGTHDELLALDGHYADLWATFAEAATTPR